MSFGLSAQEKARFFEFKPKNLEEDEYESNTTQLLSDELREIIENTIGRSIVEREDEIFNILANDVRPPNCYKWKFSREYPVFPVEDSILDWSFHERRQCFTALQKGYLTVSEVVEVKKKSSGTDQKRFEFKRDISDSASTNCGEMSESSTNDLDDPKHQRLKGEDMYWSRISPARRELVNKAEEVFTKHICDQTGWKDIDLYTEINRRDDEGNLPGWHWQISQESAFGWPEPAKASFWKWKTVDIEAALNALHCHELQFCREKPPSSSLKVRNHDPSVKSRKSSNGRLQAFKPPVIPNNLHASSSKRSPIVQINVDKQVRGTTILKHQLGPVEQKYLVSNQASFPPPLSLVSTINHHSPRRDIHAKSALDNKSSRNPALIPTHTENSLQIHSSIDRFENRENRKDFKPMEGESLISSKETIPPIKPFEVFERMQSMTPSKHQHSENQQRSEDQMPPEKEFTNNVQDSLVDEHLSENDQPLQDQQEVKEQQQSSKDQQDFPKPSPPQQNLPSIPTPSADAEKEYEDANKTSQPKHDLSSTSTPSPEKVYEDANTRITQALQEQNSVWDRMKTAVEQSRAEEARLNAIVDDQATQIEDLKYKLKLHVKQVNSGNGMQVLVESMVKAVNEASDLKVENGTLKGENKSLTEKVERLEKASKFKESRSNVSLKRKRSERAPAATELIYLSDDDVDEEVKVEQEVKRSQSGEAVDRVAQPQATDTSSIVQTRPTSIANSAENLAARNQPPQWIQAPSLGRQSAILTFPLLANITGQQDSGYATDNSTPNRSAISNINTNVSSPVRKRRRGEERLQTEVKNEAAEWAQIPSS